MATLRRVTSAWQARPTIEGAGVHLKRAFGYTQMSEFDPFLLLDDFHGYQPRDYQAGFPWHPHRGMETITYLLKGRVAHGDNLGNRGVIGPGDVQWMTAGSGIIHQEMPEGDATGELWGVQLWANLPAAQKMTPPRYQGYTADQIPTAELPGARVKVICGEITGVHGPVQGIAAAPEYLDVALQPGAVFDHELPADHTVFAYLLMGAARFAGPESDLAAPETVVRFGEGDRVAIHAGNEGARFLLVSGAPLHEPIAWRGPIVMNTQEELQTAFKELDEGTFVKVNL